MTAAGAYPGAGESAQRPGAGRGGALALLRDPEALGRLRDLVRRLRLARDAVLDRWTEHYRATLGEEGFFTEREFRAYFGSELDAILDAISAGDGPALAATLSRAGQELAAMGVPFAELVSSIHLFEDACLRSVARGDPAESLEDHRTLDRLSHIRIALLAEAYVAHREQEHLGREAALERELAGHNRDHAQRSEFLGLVGRSAPMQVLYGRLETAGRSDAPVLLVGESGTGKELAARAIHLRSPRSRGPFVPVNCAALSPALLESELFGHRRGAFTGAYADAPGLLRHAHGGTIFLDEVTEMSLEGQAKLLRALQEKAVRPVGQMKEEPADFRVVASTNRDPDGAVRSGHLRQDLLYRLQGFLIEMPPLRARLDDLPLLARAILDRAGLDHVELTAHALARLRARSWPGNVRELEAVLVAAAAAAPQGRIRVVDLPRPASHAAGAAAAGDEGPLPTLRDAEVDLIRRALRLTRGNKLRAAQALGVSRKWLYARLAERG